jgi:hypothetical protein
MKSQSIRFLLILIITLCCFISRGQVTTGSSGLINIPNGEIHPDKTMAIGCNYLPVGQAGPKFKYNTGNYYFNLSFLPFLEATYRLTFFRTDGRITNQDRSFGAKLQILKEKKRIPSLLFGMDDIYTEVQGGGNQYFASAFIASRKTFQTKAHIFRFTVGYGLNTKGRERLNGLFGGISYSPQKFKPLKLMAEYDTRHINAACSLLIARHLNLYGGYYGNKNLAAGVAWKFLLK